MYRPPQNSNRVKLIRKRFENAENKSKSPERSAIDVRERSNLINSNGEIGEKIGLQRQISDPSRRNIKRTPAFRVERSADRLGDRNSLYEIKVKQFSAVKNHCDSNSNILNKDTSEIESSLDDNKVPLSNNSNNRLDVDCFKSNTDNTCNNCHESTNANANSKTDFSLLYTQPIPKALRRNNSNCTEFSLSPTTSSDRAISSFPNSPIADSKFQTIYNVSTMKIEDKLEDLKHRVSLTDTLKLALSKPLPKGPAPKKPPRAFQIPTKETPPPKSDPKYMLNKLEDALRKNKLKLRRLPVTPPDDAEDASLLRSKSSRTLPRLPNRDDKSDYDSAFNFNCLNGFKFALTNYEKIKEPNSCFFVGNPERNSAQEEPVYAEPFHYRKDFADSSVVIRREGSSRSKQSARNSLYYMSTPLLSTEESLIRNMTDSPEVQASAENSSLSSGASDVEESPGIRTLIKCYESKSSPTNRIEDLKITLQQTLDSSFGAIGVRDTDSENESKVSDIIKKFETYRQTMPKYSSVKIGKEKLFYCCMIIEKVRDMASIKFKYPRNADVPQSIEHLCFPESDNATLDMSNQTQNYSLLITNDKGERTFGYCRRVLPEGSTCCLPLAYCILSKYRAPRFYKKILIELESRHGLPNKYRDELISQFYNQKFPKPGDSIRINLTNIEPSVYNKTDIETSIKEKFEESTELISYVQVNRTGEFLGVNKNGAHVEHIFINEQDIRKSCSTPSYIVQTKEKNELVLTLHPDTRFEDSDLKQLHELPADVLLKIFSSLLLERKVVLISSMISKLSSCIDSLQSILYPFTWHHTCIPILPESLWDIVESPTPVICGVMSTRVLDEYVIENGIVIDLDSRTVRKEEGDENKILASSMQKVWKRSLALASKAASSMEYVQSVYLSDAYLQVFILCFKDYKKYFRDGVFLKEEFLKNAKTKGMRRFLKLFTETYMFLAFVDTVTGTPENLEEFDKKIEMYGSEESNIILDKLLEWNR
ncbi:unnamed protein product [Phyllotreta striolata]|uniref:UDENN domain-containing protein n=1 Tax=Phyllotreta striolata TaxID=444603 RepID=A0A9N9TUF8_PHYSR|nr:unnamed protein product [Phyllotreta striolata]